MKTTTSDKRGVFALMVGHCAGMVDLVALPVWVGTLISRYQLDPQQAGMLATLFLAGAVLASVLVAPQFNRLPHRWVAAIGFGLSAFAFYRASSVTGFESLALWHAVAGVSTGMALSVTHGTIARSVNPHRLFAIVGIALAVFGIFFLGAAPQIVAANGGPAMFLAFAVVMAVGALTSLLAFPTPDAPAQRAEETAASSGRSTGRSTGRIGMAVWMGILAVACMALVQAMTFSFLERVGADHGFGLRQITGVLIALGLVNLFPPVMAAVLERRWTARSVMMAGPVIQAVLVNVIMNASAFVPYALAASVFAAVMIFTHTFAFGLLSRMDPTGRAMAATPAMLMVGSAIGPILGGSLVKSAGYPALGVAAVILATVAVVAVSRLPRRRAGDPVAAPSMA